MCGCVWVYICSKCVCVCTCVCECRGVPRIERGGVRIAIGGAVRILGSVVIRSTFGVRMHAYI